jgi:predicted nuclease of predicted toxin-antitoxin system
VRLLVDQNLSHRLLGLLDDLFPNSLHVRHLGLDQSDDLVIWNHAIHHNCVILTQDSDYADWNKLRGVPPKIVWLRCGNATVNEIHSKLRQAAERILLLEADSEVEVVEIW